MNTVVHACLSLFSPGQGPSVLARRCRLPPVSIRVLASDEVHILMPVRKCDIGQEVRIVPTRGLDRT